MGKKRNTVVNEDEDWRLHDSYEPGVSRNRVVTRSQTGFIRINHTLSELELFADKSRHKPPNLPHLMTTMKGQFGSIPRTIITRSCGKHFTPTEELIDKLADYKNYKPGEKSGLETEKAEGEILEGNKDSVEDDDWRLHDSYEPGVSSNRIVTRSQTGFNRINHTPSELELFADKRRHKPPKLPHLMTTMKGRFGSVPATIITRSCGMHLTPTEELIEKLADYKNYKPGEKNGLETEKAKGEILEENDSESEDDVLPKKRKLARKSRAGKKSRRRRKNN